MFKKKAQQTVPQPAQAVKKPADKMSLRFVIPMILFFVIVGILLIWLENLVTNIASCVIAAMMIIYGGWLLLRYFRSPVDRRVAGVDLAVGLILALAGILLFFNTGMLDTLLPAIWGLSLVFGGFLKIQYAFDEKSVGVNRWWIMLALAAVSLIIGILTLLRASLFGQESQHMVIGIFMLGEAVLDIVTYILITLRLKKQADEKGAIYSAALQAAETAALQAASEHENGGVTEK